ncbi:hypothetical protein TNCV_646141 [Trichonephila clavipes]|nr:hypothetical protein TNCV_646141 [Trichonephila clavipes]
MCGQTQLEKSKKHNGNVSRRYNTGRPELQLQMRTDIWQLLQKETDEAQHQTRLVSSLQTLVAWSSEHALWKPQQWARVMLSDTTPGSSYGLILTGLLYGKCQVPIATKRTLLNDTVSVEQTLDVTETEAVSTRYDAIEGRRMHGRDDGLRKTEIRDAIHMD